ncbi:MAG TPA: hypothetical protein VMU03_15710, partial [Gammaproteobacteria bacterium]|nr:hypothetical protein [Gammaproteobacteria bacterium]
MKVAALMIATSVVVSTAALAQQTQVQGNAAAESQTSASANRSGATVTNDSAAQGNVAAQHTGAGPASASSAAGTQMNASLERSVDASHAKPGDEVRAKVNEDAKSEGGTTIPRGATLVGHVTQARPHTRGQAGAQGAAASELGIVFDKAVLKDGREIPLHATIQALAAAESRAQSDFGSEPSDTHGVSGGAAGGGGFGGGVGRVGGGAVAAGGGLAGGTAATAGGAVGGAAHFPGSAAGAAAGGAGAATAHGGSVIASAGAVGGLDASGRWLSGSHGVFGMSDVSMASSASGAAEGTLLTSTSHSVRLDGGTRMLLVGGASAS